MLFLKLSPFVRLRKQGVVYRVGKQRLCQRVAVALRMDGEGRQLAGMWMIVDSCRLCQTSMRYPASTIKQLNEVQQQECLPGSRQMARRPPGPAAAAAA